MIIVQIALLIPVLNALRGTISTITNAYPAPYPILIAKNATQPAYARNAKMENTQTKEEIAYNALQIVISAKIKIYVQNALTLMRFICSH